MEFVISSASLDKLKAIMGGAGGASGSTGSSSKGLGGLQSIMEKFTIGNITKLAAISVGITMGVGLVRQITKMVINSSPMLQQMLKLINFGFMMVLRPIGDFIGFFLRPIIMVLMRQVFIPFYRDYRKTFQNWGTELGTNIANFITWGISNMPTMLQSLQEALAFMPAVLLSTQVILPALEKISGFIESLDIDLGEISSAVGEMVAVFFDSIATRMQEWWDNVVGKFTAFTENISKGLTDIVTKISGAFELFTTFFVGGLGNIGNLLGASWEAFTTWITETLGGIGTTLESAWTSFTSFFESIGNVWGILGASWEAFLDFIANLNPMNWTSGIVEAAEGFVQSITNGGNTENKVNVDIQGGGGNIADEAIEGLKQLVFGWLEDSNSKRY